MARPIALAVATLITSSSLVENSMGRSAGFAPFRILDHIIGRAVVGLTLADAVTEQSSVLDEVASAINAGQPRRQRIGRDLAARIDQQSIRENDYSVRSVARESLERRTELIDGAHLDWRETHSQLCSGGLGFSSLDGVRWIAGVNEGANLVDARAPGRARFPTAFRPDPARE